LELVVQTVPAGAAIPAVQSGRADLAAGDWYRTAERAKVLSLSDPLFLDQTGIVSKTGEDAPSAFKGKAVGVRSGDFFVDDVKKAIGSTVRVYQSNDAQYQDVKSGRLDAIFTSYTAGAAQLKAKPIDGVQIKVAQRDPQIKGTVEPPQATFPVHKDNTGLTTALNDGVKALRDSGELAKIVAANGMDASAVEVGDPRLS
jgi:polar amino acid transport system substrate-binding protein